MNHKGEEILTLKVVYQVDALGRRLDYQLDSNCERHQLVMQDFPPQHLAFDLCDFFDGFLNHLTLADFTAIANPRHDPYFHIRQQASSLFDQLFPQELQEILWRLRNEDLHLRILSNETTIPWGLVALQSPTNSAFHQQGPFLVEAFKLSQRVSNLPPYHRFRIRKLGLLAFGDDLPYVEEEKKFIQSLATPHLKVLPISPTLADVHDALSLGNFDAIHLCCHGKLQPNHLGGIPSIPLEDGTFLQTPHLMGEARNFGRNHPFIFFNGCFSSRTMMDLQGESSWPRAFLQQGAGAFIGTLWEIKDKTAFQFTKVFYEAFLKGVPLGLAVQKARLEIQAQQSGTWLAYASFGEPGACALTTDHAVVTTSIKDDSHSESHALLSDLHQRMAEHLQHPLYPLRRDLELPQLFALFWNANRKESGRVWQVQDLKILAIMAIAKEPLTVSMISSFTGFSTSYIAQVLTFWSPLLICEQACDEATDLTQAYALCHPSLERLMIHACHRQDGGTAIEDAHRHIIRTLETLEA